MAPMLGVCEAADAGAVSAGGEVDDVDVPDNVMDDMVVRVNVIKLPESVGEVVEGVLSGIVSCEVPEGPIPTMNVELLDIQRGSRDG